MDYCFFLHRVAEITPTLHQDLIRLTSEAVLDPKTSYFVPGRHPGLLSGGFQFNSSTPQAIRSLLNEMDPVFPKDKALSYVINRIAPGGTMLEHTDATGGEMSRGMFVNTQHLIHISITGNAKYLHRRDKDLPNKESRMQNGGVYAFNNYVFHTVENDSPIERINLIVYYSDPDWTIKKKLYNHLGIKSSTY